MNLFKRLFRRAWFAFALCAGALLIPAGHAQPAPQRSDSRYLFIFDTSADMKKRLPAVQAEVNVLMSSAMGGQLRAGDSLGVWTFDKDLHTGQFPLRHWNAEDAVTIASNINQFVGKQHYGNSTRFNALQPQLNQLIQTSARLTVLIFCDGEDEIKWTPYDASINQVIAQRQAGQKKARQPIVLVLRSQFGQYAGCAINFPPGMVTLPEFPPLPAPVKTPPPTPPPAPAVKPPIGPPLIIIGTKVETNWPPAPAPAPTPTTNSAPMTPANMVPAEPTNAVAPRNPVAPPPPSDSAPMPLTNTVLVPSTGVVAPQSQVAPPPPPPIPVPAIQTNAAPAPPANAAAPTNLEPVTPAKLVLIPPTNPVASTNLAAPLPETSGPARKAAFVVGGALLFAAGALATLAFFRSRQTSRGSLISRSMKKD